MAEKVGEKFVNRRKATDEECVRVDVHMPNKRGTAVVDVSEKCLKNWGLIFKILLVP